MNLFCKSVLCICFVGCFVNLYVSVLCGFVLRVCFASLFCDFVSRICSFRLGCDTPNTPKLHITLVWLYRYVFLCVYVCRYVEAWGLGVPRAGNVHRPRWVHEKGCVG